MPSEPEKIIVIGGSLGGIEALKTLASDLPATLPAALLVVLHVGPYGLNSLDQIISRAGPLPATNAVHGEKIQAGHIYIAPADRHLLVDPDGRLILSRGPKENRSRPAIDPLFRSAAAAFGPRVIGVVLTGLLDDGTAGLWAVKEQGGVAVVQHPEDALAPDMPLNAVKHVEVNHCIPLKKIAPLLIDLTAMSPRENEEKSVPKKMAIEVGIARARNALESGVIELGDPSVFTCPECHGVLLQLKEGSHLRFRCHTGHAFSSETLLAELVEKTEESLWNVLRAIDETVLLLSRLALDNSRPDEAALLRQKADEAKRRSDLIRQTLRPESDNP
jgi:two-component system chemotaxis response regulator CheB